LVKENSNSSELKALIDAGVAGFKCFLIDSGVPEFSNVNEQELRNALQLLQGKVGILI
jgi:allantoinase